MLHTVLEQRRTENEARNEQVCKIGEEEEGRAMHMHKSMQDIRNAKRKVRNSARN